MDRVELEAAFQRAEAHYRSLAAKAVALEKARKHQELPSGIITDSNSERVLALREWNRVFALLRASDAQSNDG